MEQHNSSTKSWVRKIALTGALASTMGMRGHEPEIAHEPTSPPAVAFDMAMKKSLSAGEYFELLDNALLEGDETGKLFQKNINLLTANSGTLRLVPRVGDTPTKLTIKFNGTEKEMVHYAALLDVTFNPNIQVEGKSSPVAMSELLGDIIGDGLATQPEDKRQQLKEMLKIYDKLWDSVHKSLNHEIMHGDKNAMLVQGKLPFDLFYQSLGMALFTRILPKGDLELQIIDPRVAEPTQVSQRSR